MIHMALDFLAALQPALRAAERRRGGWDNEAISRAGRMPADQPAGSRRSLKKIFSHPVDLAPSRST
ncbi:MAG: hypothetical protein ACLGH0_11590 [Thermoanaerobaculia bacterium]